MIDVMGAIGGAIGGAFGGGGGGAGDVNSMIANMNARTAEMRALSEAQDKNSHERAIIKMKSDDNTQFTKMISDISGQKTQLANGLTADMKNSTR